MPLYEYQCRECGHRFEKIQSFSAPEEKECPKCAGAVEKLISAPAIQFKGAGWYVNDYAGRSKAPASSESKDGGAKSAGDAKGSTSGDSGGSSSASSGASSGDTSSSSKAGGGSGTTGGPSGSSS